ncbi:RDD family protein [Wolbachia endosymbiont of Pentidionis agamae]|uniref:RDD family protein n=1 Tax=Wolbachia endosymbiont of Pentidionis agamae TaxID=3110435 RepID=UPI002FD49E02
MDAKVNYVGIIRRVIASMIDTIIVIAMVLPIIFFQVRSANLVDLVNGFSDIDIIRAAFFEHHVLTTIVIETIFFAILEIFLLIKFSGTPGYLLLGVRIKDANTLKNVSIMQAAVRCVFTHIIIGFILSFFPIIELIVLTILIVLAAFDKQKQFLHDKIVKTVAIMHSSK